MYEPPIGGGGDPADERPYPAAFVDCVTPEHVAEQTGHSVGWVIATAEELDGLYRDVDEWGRSRWLIAASVLRDLLRAAEPPHERRLLG